MRDRYVGLMFHIDTNRLNSRQEIENMNQLEKWANDGVITLEMAERTLREATAGNHPARTKKAVGHIFSITYADTPDEQNRLVEIEKTLFPSGAKDQNQKNDAEIVFNAGKYCRILITNDGASKKQPGGILGNKDELKRKFGIDVMNDGDAVKLVRNRIESRDKHCKIIADRTGEALPEWVGKD